MWFHNNVIPLQVDLEFQIVLACFLAVGLTEEVSVEGEETRIRQPHGSAYSAPYGQNNYGAMSSQSSYGAGSGHAGEYTTPTYGMADNSYPKPSYGVSGSSYGKPTYGISDSSYGMNNYGAGSGYAGGYDSAPYGGYDSSYSQNNYEHPYGG